MGDVIPLLKNKNETVLVTGANGYIGAQLCKAAMTQGDRVLGIDLTIRARHPYTSLYVPVNYGAGPTIRDLIKEHNIKTVYHVAATSLVEPSMRQPLNYYSNNVGNLTDLLSACVDEGVERFVFSSSAAIYGDARNTHGICSEDMLPEPVNPYGMSKAMGEHIIHDACQMLGLNAVILRYFNVAGADSAHNNLGQVYGATHVLPKIMDAVRRQDTFTIFGDDYKTPDGTAVRDYVHVEDVAEANLLAANYLKEHDGYHVFNIGSGKGISVREIFDTTCDVLGINISCDSAPRRAGDPPVLVADINYAYRELNWQPTRNLRQIIEDANNWYSYQADT